MNIRTAMVKLVETLNLKFVDGLQMISCFYQIILYSLTKSEKQ